MNQKGLNKLKMKVYVLLFRFYFHQLLDLFNFFNFACLNHALCLNLYKRKNKKVVKLSKESKKKTLKDHQFLKVNQTSSIIRKLMLAWWMHAGFYLLIEIQDKLPVLINHFNNLENSFRNNSMHRSYKYSRSKVYNFKKM